MGPGKYVLGGKDGRTPIRESDLTRWAAWYEQSDRVVALTGNGVRHVSTVFLGLDHNFDRAFGGGGKPILFETRVFGGTHDELMEHYATWEEAEAGHKRCCELVFGKAFAEATKT